MCCCMHAGAGMGASELYLMRTGACMHALTGLGASELYVVKAAEL